MRYVSKIRGNVVHEVKEMHGHLVFTKCGEQFSRRFAIAEHRGPTCKRCQRVNLSEDAGNGRFRICLNCGMEPARRGSMFCSDECREEWRDERYT
jgi:hypothetical protein